ncbi:putative glutathione S-transferase [Heterostelium album PN500]|uniref:Putative glutathione S-transferase n=1 Tax=Heterostelium pallidum (strain ATCC 26659 / Pp 5 / PN500) TaxID=670386 RepID=D3BJJ7_HETP5|nr:putative glutathione S-transferase [Heterostelium album PN500]EFA78077.1 putative glutathione S-transferase [Heterostelium album PN500]|eukprot:XP_020430204.1 putative glutathione S-transferase [Heterostelium album PN500]
MEAKLKIIEFYGAPSPNVVKIHLLLRELREVPYSYHEINIRRGEQYSPDFLMINPNGKLPAVVDHDVEGEPISVFESGNILYYLANKYDKLIPNIKTDPKSHTEVLNWVFWQMSNLGPVLGELIHVCCLVKDRQYIASKDQFTIADIATYPWARYVSILPDISVEEFPHLYRWLALVKSRPSVAEWEEFEEEQKKNNNNTNNNNNNQHHQQQQQQQSSSQNKSHTEAEERKSLIHAQRSVPIPISNNLPTPNNNLSPPISNQT